MYIVQKSGVCARVVGGEGTSESDRWPFNGRLLATFASHKLYFHFLEDEIYSLKQAS